VFDENGYQHWRDRMSKKKCCNSKKPCKNCPKLRKGERIDSGSGSVFPVFISMLVIGTKKTE
jgi:hypothetical protein